MGTTQLHRRGPGQGHSARAVQTCSAPTSMGAARARALSPCRAGSQVGCSAPEADGWEEKSLWKTECLETETIRREHAWTSPSLVTIDPVPEHDGTAAFNQKAGGFLFFPLFNVGKTTFLLSSFLPPCFPWKGLNWFS